MFRSYTFTKCTNVIKKNMYQEVQTKQIIISIRIRILNIEFLVTSIKMFDRFNYKCLIYIFLIKFSRIPIIMQRDFLFRVFIHIIIFSANYFTIKNFFYLSLSKGCI